jgi:hypothetical protein
MAKFHLLLVTLALVAASSGKISGAVAATDVDSDLAQRREEMAEFHRVFSNPKLAAAADSEMVQRMGFFMKREIGPIGPILAAIRKMPENSAADARIKEEAIDAALALLIRHFRKLMPSPFAKTDDL